MDLLYAYFEENKATVPELADVAKADLMVKTCLLYTSVRGFHSGGVATTLKHFPGHGDALADSHDGAVYAVSYTHLDVYKRQA